MVEQRSFRTILLCAMLLPLASCVDPDERADAGQSSLVVPPMMNTRPATFKCEDAGRVVVRPVGDDGKAIVLALAQREIPLKSVAASEGQKYSDGDTVFWVNGPNATLLVKGKQEAQSCEKQ